MTLISFGTNGGERRRCDATCHNAEKPECTCICGGRYHGKKEGSEELRSEIRAAGEEILAKLNMRQLEKLGFTEPASPSQQVAQPVLVVSFGDLFGD
jgi:hypothetical protein